MAEYVEYTNNQLVDIDTELVKLVPPNVFKEHLADAQYRYDKIKVRAIMNRVNKQLINTIESNIAKTDESPRASIIVPLLASEYAEHGKSAVEEIIKQGYQATYGTAPEQDDWINVWVDLT